VWGATIRRACPALRGAGRAVRRVARSSFLILEAGVGRVDGLFGASARAGVGRAAFPLAGVQGARDRRAPSRARDLETTDGTAAVASRGPRLPRRRRPCSSSAPLGRAVRDPGHADALASAAGGEALDVLAPRRGPPSVAREIRELVLRLARENLGLPTDRGARSVVSAQVSRPRPSAS
jgi:hypothetical protein